MRPQNAIMIKSLLTAVSLCADCFAVSICSGVTIRRDGNAGKIFKAAAAFAVIQTGLLLAGWLLGSAFLSAVRAISGIIGFLLLLYVGGSMVLEARKGECQPRDLDGWKNIILAGLATSIDAMAVGGAESMRETPESDGMAALAISVFAVTALSVMAGLRFGSRLGNGFGRWAELAGGLVLITLGILMII